MGLFSWLFGGTSAEPPFMAGDGGYEHEVVGESYYQDVLSAICGGPCEDGHEFDCVALLVPEPDNPYDYNAVVVIIEGRKVAHLSRDEAVVHHRELSALGLGGRAVRCAALINGGWSRPRRGGRTDAGHFGIELDLVRPMRPA